ETLPNGGNFQQSLSFFEVQIEVGRDQVSEFSGLIGVERIDFDLLGESRRKIDDFLELKLRVAREGGHLERFFKFIFKDLSPGANVGFFRDELLDFKTPEA